QPTSNEPFTLFARHRFFGLTELESFMASAVEPYAKSGQTDEAVLDFSCVMVWDISALLWLVIGLHHFKQEYGFSFRLRLPDNDGVDDPALNDRLGRSADYLRRWRFDRALRNINPNVDDLLINEQQGFFSTKEPRNHYLPRKTDNESGLLQSLISRSLAEIRNLSDPKFTGSQPISVENISQSVKDFQAARIGDILHNQCNFTPREADLFSDNLITEALLNVQEHPKASIGMIAISILGTSNEIILTIVDNGESIPETIYPKYLTCQQRNELNLDDRPTPQYQRDEITHEERVEITNYATKAGISRKEPREGHITGMGLTHIRDDTVNTFGGKLIIITDKVKLQYKGNSENPPESEKWQHEWRGNLLRIALPLSK
ncbi:MAG: hypothetical protein U1G05_14655, partial [Kiritimatiellia bacterium]